MTSAAVSIDSQNISYSSLCEYSSMLVVDDGYITAFDILKKTIKSRLYLCCCKEKHKRGEGYLLFAILCWKIENHN